MKVSAMFYAVVATFLLIVLTAMATLNFPFNWVFYTTVIGQAFVILMVYKVLTDSYQTTKTFAYLYEDYPLKAEDLQSLPKKR